MDTELISFIDENMLALKQDIETPEQYESARKASDECKRNIKSIEEGMETDIANAFKTHSGLCTKKNNAIAPYQTLLDLCATKRGDYDNRMAMEQRRLDAEASERERLRLLEEAKADAEVLRDMGEDDMADTTLDMAIQAPAPKVKADSVLMAKKGSRTRATWYGEVVDESLLPREFMIPNRSKINKAVREAQGNIVIEGVENRSQTTTK